MGLAADHRPADLSSAAAPTTAMFRAYDASTGEQLWHFRTNSGIIAPPSTFEVNGVQYVAVQSG